MPGSGERGGLRERKKARTRAAIQAAALDLFAARGYDATTVAQIAAAAEVGEATFYRYFATKADVVLWDDFDPRIVSALRARAPHESLLEAVRASFREVFDSMTSAERQDLIRRTRLVLSVPELRAASFDQLAGATALLAQAIGERAGRNASDPGVRAFAGAVVGVAIEVQLQLEDRRKTDMGHALDEALGAIQLDLRPPDPPDMRTGWR